MLEPDAEMACVLKRATQGLQVRWVVASFESCTSIISSTLRMSRQPGDWN
jgi:hypothetical protein